MNAILDEIESDALFELPDGRYDVEASSKRQQEHFLIEKRGDHVALQLRGRWYGVHRGQFVIRERPFEIHGDLWFGDGELVLDAHELVLATGIRLHWRKRQCAQSPDVPQREQVTLVGTAHYYFLDGPSRTPLHVSAEIIRQSASEQYLVLPPALTTSRGTLRLLIEPNGSFSYRAPDGSSFKVQGHLSKDRIDVAIETAGSIGWTKKELSGVL